MTRVAQADLGEGEAGDGGDLRATGETDPARWNGSAGERKVYRYTRRPVYHVPRGLWWPGLLLALVMGGVFYWTIGRMWERWNNTHGYYQHGPLVVPISLVMAWLIVRKRGLPLESTRGSRWAGMALVIGAMLVHLLSMYPRVTFLSGMMIPPAIAGCMLYLGGWAMLGRLWFPVAFLFFMVPLPDVTINDINFPLKLFAASASTSIVDASGVSAYVRGSDIVLQGGTRLTVEDACSGLRSLISLMAFATLFTYACKLRGYKRALLFLSAVPVAVAANIVRIVVLTLVAHSYGVKLATPGGWVHDTMGYVVFVVAFCIMFLLEELLDLLPGARSGRGLLSGQK
jgi:exosortase